MYVFLMFYGSNTLDRRGLFNWSTLGRKAVSIFHGIMPGLHSLAVFLLVAYTPPPHCLEEAFAVAVVLYRRLMRGGWVGGCLLGRPIEFPCL